MEIKHIDFSKDWFTANGIEYIIRNTMSIARFQEYEKLQNHFAFGLSFSQIVDRLNQSIEFANKGKGVEAWNVIFNLKEGIVYRVEDRLHPALLQCSIFIVTEDEDLTKWDEQLARKKIEDWKTEGIDMNDFFELASNFLHGFIKIYNEISQSISLESVRRKEPTARKSSK